MPYQSLGSSAQRPSVKQPQVQNGVAAALDGEVPGRINAVLGSLPTRLEVGRGEGGGGREVGREDG